MTSVDLSAIVALVCYLVLLSFRVQVGHRRDVALGAAFAPALALVSLHSRPSTIVLCLGGAGGGVLVGSLLRRRWTITASDLVAFVATFGAVRLTYAFGGLALKDVPLLIASGGIGVATFAAVDALSTRALGRQPRLLAEERRVWFVLHALLLSAFGLTILVYQEIGSLAFVAVLLPLVLTKREFDRYALARSTLQETVTALEALEARSL